MSEAYDQNDQVPIVVPCVSRGDHIALGHVVHMVGRIIWWSQWCSQAQKAMSEKRKWVAYEHRGEPGSSAWTPCISLAIVSPSSHPQCASGPFSRSHHQFCHVVAYWYKWCNFGGTFHTAYSTVSSTSTIYFLFFVSC